MSILKLAAWPCLRRNFTCPLRHPCNSGQVSGQLLSLRALDSEITLGMGGWKLLVGDELTWLGGINVPKSAKKSLYERWSPYGNSTYFCTHFYGLIRVKYGLCTGGFGIRILYVFCTYFGFSPKFIKIHWNQAKIQLKFPKKSWFFGIFWEIPKSHQIWP